MERSRGVRGVGKKIKIRNADKDQMIKNKRRDTKAGKKESEITKNCSKIDERGR